MHKKNIYFRMIHTILLKIVKQIILINIIESLLNNVKRLKLKPIPGGLRKWELAWTVSFSLRSIFTILFTSYFHGNKFIYVPNYYNWNEACSFEVWMPSEKFVQLPCSINYIFFKSFWKSNWCHYCRTWWL